MLQNSGEKFWDKTYWQRGFSEFTNSLDQDILRMHMTAKQMIMYDDG